MKKSFIPINIISVVIFLALSSCNTQNNKSAEIAVLTDSITQQLNLLTTKQRLETENKKLVADFYQKLFGDKDISAIDSCIVDAYIQHNPNVTDGKEALKEAVTKWFMGAPKETIDIQHLGADGNLVYIHTKAKMGEKVFSIIDIFRIENHKIVEHWDVMQEVPEKSVNSHPMF